MARANASGKRWIVRKLPLCACGCGTSLPRTRRYGKMRLIYGEYPRFAPGHWARSKEAKTLITGRPDVISAWLAENQGRFLCQCGCGTKIILQREYHFRGVPCYSHGHHPNSRNRRKSGFVKDDTVRKFRRAEKVEIISRSGGRCALCRRGGPGEAQHLEVDHIIPFSKGGKTTLENAQALCRKCHASKTKTDTQIRAVHAGGRGFRGEGK